MSTLANAARDAVQSTSPAAVAAALVAAVTSPSAVPPEAAAPAPAPAAPVAAAPTSDVAAIRAEARQAERTRIQAIVGHAEADGRSALAQHLAFSTDLAPDAAGSILATSPKAEAPRTLTGATVPQPNVKPQGSDPAPADAKADSKSRLAAARMAITGQKA
jgi:hypothetical protein